MGSVYKKGSDLRVGEGEGEFGVFSAKHWDRRSSDALIEFASPYHDAQMVGPYRVSNPLHLTVLAVKSNDYTTAPQHLQIVPIETLHIVLHFRTFPIDFLDCSRMKWVKLLMNS